MWATVRWAHCAAQHSKGTRWSGTVHRLASFAASRKIYTITMYTAHFVVLLFHSSPHSAAFRSNFEHDWLVRHASILLQHRTIIQDHSTCNSIECGLWYATADTDIVNARESLKMPSVRFERMQMLQELFCQRTGEPDKPCGFRCVPSAVVLSKFGQSVGTPPQPCGRKARITTRDQLYDMAVQTSIPDEQPR